MTDVNEMKDYAGGASGCGILLIDDESSLRLTFEMFLKRAGYGPITGVSTIDAAIDAIEKNDFDLIISDILLEGASGIDILRHLRELGKTCPMVMVTGYPNIETAAEAVRLGAFDYLPKPVKKDALLDVVGRALDQQTKQKEKEHIAAEREKAHYYQDKILRSVREVIITVDPQLLIIDMNDMAREWTKSFMPEIKIGETLSSLTNPVAKALLADLESVRATRHAVKEHRLEWQRSDGVPGVLSVTAAQLDDVDGKFGGVVLTARDVTNVDDVKNRKDRKRFHRLVGASPAMQKVYALLENVGPVDSTVLITGESGTGKELVAEALHSESARSKRALVKVDCASISEELLESELFGHKKGAFTGAERDRLGRILQADGGTLFLDEIGDISSLMQLRLLRFLQERVFYPVGRDQPIQVDVRVIAATNADLKQKVKDGEFREDLLFRLRVVDVSLPPLRNRTGDVPLLAQHFLEQLEERMSKGVKDFSGDALETLDDYVWPGNVRELEHVVERAYVFCPGDIIGKEHLPGEVLSGDKKKDLPQPQTRPVQVPTVVAEKEPEDERERILYALRRAGGNKAKAARLLGIDRSTIYRKIRYYKIEEPDEDLNKGLL